MGGLAFENLDALTMGVQSVVEQRDLTLDAFVLLAVDGLGLENGAETFFDSFKTRLCVGEAIIHLRKVSCDGVQALVHAFEFFPNRGELLVKELIELLEQIVCH